MSTAVVIVSAFGGRLAGAVLQPVLQHGLDRLRSITEIERRREQRLRRMVEANLDRGRRLSVAGIERLLAEERGEPVPTPSMMRRLEETQYALWQPRRIPDATLRGLAEEHNKLSNFLFSAVYRQHDSTEEQRREARDRLQELSDEIVARMDELHWPEADS